MHAFGCTVPERFASVFLNYLLILKSFLHFDIYNFIFCKRKETGAKHVRITRSLILQFHIGIWIMFLTNKHIVDIQTHPTQTCFMSSVDLHTHYSYQVLLYMCDCAFVMVCLFFFFREWSTDRKRDVLPPFQFTCRFLVFQMV